MSERAVLGCILVDQSLLEHVRCLGVTQDHFIEERNKVIWNYMGLMDAQGLDIDMVSVTEALRSKGKLDNVGGPHYVSILTDALYDPGHIDSYVKGMKESSLRRRLEFAGERIRALSKSTDGLNDLISRAESELAQALSLSGTVLSDGKEVGVVAGELIEQYRTGAIPSIHSQFQALNEKLGGFCNGRLYYIAGRPGMGKTALMLDLAKYAVDDGYPAAVFSLEMSAGELAGRLLSQDTGIPLTKIHQSVLSELEWERLEDAKDGMAEWPLLIQDGAGIHTVEGIAARAKSLKLKQRLRLLFIDYLQLVVTESRFGSKNEEVSYTSRTLKLLAKELDVPIVVLSQLNRGLENRPDKRPKLSDLRDSGSLEQDADGVMFIYRPGSYMTPDTTNGKSELLLAKNRHGPTGTVFLKWKGETTSFSNWY